MSRKLLLSGAIASVLGYLAIVTAFASSSEQPALGFDFARLVAACLAWLVPAGFILVAAAGVPHERAWQTALAGVAGAALGVLLFFAAGFGLAFGGLGLVTPAAAGYGDLAMEWTLVAGEWGYRWGMAGLSGWALGGPAATSAAYTLFFTQLPWVATAAMIPLLALRGRTPSFSSLLAALLIGGLLYPLSTNWVWGGGWLANLGANLNLGHGFVDFAGAGTVHLLGAAAALAGLLVLVARRSRKHDLAAADSDAQAVELPPAHLPLLAAVGALLILAGSLSWAWANPLLDVATLLPMRGVINAILVATAAALLPLAYTWFAAGKPDPLMAARGLAAGAVAGAGFGPFFPPWAAVATGLVVGLIVPLVTYLVREVIRLDDDTGLAAVHLVGGLIGLLAVGILSDGLAGAGWNGVGATSFLGVEGQGVTGLVAAPGYQPDWPGQMQAQLIGIAALFLVAFLAGLIVFGLLAVFAHGFRRMASLRDAAGRQSAPAVAVAAGDDSDLSEATLPDQPGVVSTGEA
jgi:Amt family ammonium transporter